MLYGITTQINPLASDPTFIWLHEEGINITVDKAFIVVTHIPRSLFDMPSVIQNNVLIDPTGIFEIVRVSETQTVIKNLSLTSIIVDIVWADVIGSAAIGDNFIIS